MSEYFCLTCFYLLECSYDFMDICKTTEEGIQQSYELTVTPTSRPKTVTHMEKKPNYIFDEYSNLTYNHSLENGMLNQAKIIYELEMKNESEIESKKQQLSDVTQINANNHIKFDNIIQVEIEDEKSKKKEKKWTLGGFFRRRNKKDADDSSEESGEDNKKGFLSRQKLKRDRRKFKSRNYTNGFDVVIPQHKESANNKEISVKQFWSSDFKTTEPSREPLRYINRHPELNKINSLLQISKHCRKDSNLSKSTGGSENSEGKKNRKEVMARVEAKRDMLQGDSSSDEYESYRSNSSLYRLNGDCRKPRRTDKHKRLSKDEEPQSDLRVVKSDFEEGRRLPFNCRWISKAYCPDSSDHEIALMNHSVIQSSYRSPWARQKPLPQCKIMPNSYSMSTFPPGVHFQHSRNGSLNVSPIHNNFTKENQALINCRNQVYVKNRDFDSLPKSINIPGNSNRKTPMNYEHFKNSSELARKKSSSYDQNIHKTSCFENESEVNKKNQQQDSKIMMRSELFMNNDNNIYDHDPQRVMTAHYEVVENKTDSTSSLQSGILPQKSTSGNSFYESTRNFHPNRSNSHQNIQSVHGYCSQENISQLKSSKTKTYSNVSPSSESMCHRCHLDGTPSILRYYADQNPRSRNPIQITCNPTISEQLYLSDSQMIVKSVQSARKSASDFWKTKDKELMKQQKKWENFLTPLSPQNNSGFSRSSSNSSIINAKIKNEIKVVPKSSENESNEFKSSPVDGRQINKISLEKHSSTEVSKHPSESSFRRFSNQTFMPLLKKAENEINKMSLNEKIHSNNLDEALNELEVIYNSLSLKDEDLEGQSVRRDFPVFRPRSPITSDRDKIQNFFGEVDHCKNAEFAIPVEHQQALPPQRSSIPDKTTDDMAFRRLNQRGKTEVKKLPFHSYLRNGPALLPVQNVSSTFRKESTVLEPDITYDDVVFRNIRHANSTLKVQDPQPPFGIPVGIITPASSSDYLHATPAERFRPTFASCKTPDVVKDDLAFRNLRKDNKTNVYLEPNKNELKKRAVRSLSANLYSIMQKDNPDFTSVEANNVDVFVQNHEKTQSLTDLTKGKYILEKRLKELKEEKNAKRAEFFEVSQDPGKNAAVNWRDFANLKENRDDLPVNKFQKITSPIRLEDNWKKFKSPVVELSKFPAAIPSSSLQGNPFKESSFVDDDQLENLLSMLAKEAESASKDLEMQLEWLEKKKASDVDEKSKAIEEFNEKFSSLNKTKRKRNLSLSNANEYKEEIRKTGSLERRKETNKNEFTNKRCESKTEDVNFIGRVANKNDKTKSGSEKNLSKLSSVCCLGYRERERNQSFEVVTDLSEILKDVEAEQHLNSVITQKETNNVFQEVYEYNCKFSSPNDRAIRGGVENVKAIKEIYRIPNVISDVETEFEKLHEEVNSPKETKETDCTQVDDLMADITSIDQSQGDSYSSFPFPNDNETLSNSRIFKHRDRTSPPSRGEEFPPHSNGSYTDFDNTIEVFREEAEIQIKMFQKNKERRSAPISNSSSDNDPKSENIENYKSSRGREFSNLDLTTKSFKTTRKKENLRKDDVGSPFIKSYLNSQYCDNQVPSSDSCRFSSRRDKCKTDSASGCSTGRCRSVISGAAGLRETVIVRETKASRLRAASRNSASKIRSPLLKVLKEVKRNEKDVQSNSISGTFNSDLDNKKDIDKSYTRKSHLNRSHTSEGVYGDVYMSGGSYVRRRRSKNLSLESLSVKPTTGKCISSTLTMENVNGTMKDSQASFDRSSRTNLITKSSFNVCQKSVELVDKYSLKPSLYKKFPDDILSMKFQTVQSSEYCSNKPKQIDIATRAEILAVSTLRMISRLDEINKKSRRAIADSCGSCLPINASINDGNFHAFKTHEKKVFSLDDITSGISLNRICLKAKKSKSSKKLSEKKKMEEKPSILKSKPSEVSSPSRDSQKPVSILKRKSFCQDDSQSSSPPVTFSPSVFKKGNDVKKQSILKKRRSLDESEVMRRRTYASDANCDFKSILKTQRRLSMEELTRRSHSPDLTPQGILKRKSSKEEELEDEPQGILKRKSLPCLNLHQHVKIFDNLSNRGTDASENVRPILKKKSSSEEHSASEPSFTEGPKSILKKKGSLEVDEQEEKPMKPILKSRRILSTEESEDGKRNKNFMPNALDEPKPILKRENSRSGESENEVILRNVANRRQRPYSSSDIDSELNTIFLEGQSLEFQPMRAINFDVELPRAKSASLNERLREDFLKRSFSVAEKINNFENFLKVEKVTKEKRNSFRGTFSSDFVQSKKMENRRAVSSCSSGALPKKRSGNALGQMALELNSNYNEESNDVGSNPRIDVKFRTNSENFKINKTSSGLRQDARIDQLFRKISFHSKDFEDVFFSNFMEQSDKKYDTDSYCPVDSCGKIFNKIGNISSNASLFNESLKNCNGNTEMKKIARESSDNAAINRCLEKKLLHSSGQRYQSHPVSTEEVAVAVQKNKTNDEVKSRDQDGSNEDEMRTMIYEGRLQLFESAFASKFPESIMRKKGIRYRTQPVTSDEVEAVKNQKFSSPIYEILSTRHSDKESIGQISIKVNNCDLPSILKNLKITDSKFKFKGILKNLHPRSECEVPDLDSDTPNTEKKGILKNDLNENSQNLKKTLRKVDKEATSGLRSILKQPSSKKKGSSSSEEESVKNECNSSPKLGISGSNLAAILQRVELIGENVRKFSKREKPGVLPEYMQSAGTERVITSRSENNSLIVESQSNSECAECSLVSNGKAKVKKHDETPVNFQSKIGTENPLLRSVGCRENTTQPLRSSDEGIGDDMNGASIQQRLARLKKSGELDWQKRKSHVTNLEDELSIISAGNHLFVEYSLLRGENSNSAIPVGKENEEFRNSSSILADRLGKLDAAKQGWKKRIKPSDAVCFSVEGKMLKKRASLSPPDQSKASSPARTPLLERKKRSPKAVRFKSKQWNSSLSSVLSSPSERIYSTIARCVSAPGSEKNSFFDLPVCGNLKEINKSVVLVPKNDDETFTSFFDGLKFKQGFQENLEIKDEDLDAVTNMKSIQLLVQKRNIQTQKRRTTVKNPIKALAARINLQEYTEIKTDVAELKRIKVEKCAKNSNLAIEALAGLASQEDFTTVNLRNSTESGITSPDAPYKNLMLLQVKGRRHVQTRLIEPIARNINTGDCFILVTPSRVFHYVGEFANVIEKSRGAEISLHIQQKGDLGCTATSVITIGLEGRASTDQVKEFWKLLNGEPGCEQEAGNLDEDELFESALIDTNMVYEVLNDELVPVEVYWGSIPKIEILDPNKILVFDFGSEFYIWSGKNVKITKRKMALKLARELWEEGFDYTDCDLCPLTVASYLGNQTSWCEILNSEKTGSVRPNWALFAKITQNMETVLFREKFLDWPDYTRVIGEEKKNGNGEQIFSSGVLDAKPCDAKKMLMNVLPEPDLVLEGNHLGRGIKYFNEETRKVSQITTQNVTVWHVNEYEYSELPAISIGHFHMGDSYVVRWHYVITITGRELGGQPSKHLTTGRNRYAYFLWQGQDSPINDKGASACLTVELDKERGPQVRVVQGLEPPAFINLFKGQVVVHMGRRFSETPCETLRLFISRGAVESESALFEVPCSMRQLRSLASFVLVNKDTGKVIVWHGWKSPEACRKIAFNAAKCLELQAPEFDFKAEEINIREEIEGSESQDFIRALGGDNRHLYFSLIQDKTELRTPRLFHLTGVSGEFIFNEVMSFLAVENSTTPLPFLQSDLYSASQPALFLLDGSSGLWLWQGWCEKNSENERGSEYIRFQGERRAAMLTAMAYWNLKYGTSAPKAYLIWAGLEPLEFTNHFPFWTDRDDVSEINMKDGRKPGEVILIKTELASLTQLTYPLAQLLNRPLPDGVNPTSLEDYLEPQCFLELFAMEKEEFLNLPSWKKKKLKQDAGLF